MQDIWRKEYVRKQDQPRISAFSISLCSRLFSGFDFIFDFVFAFDFVSPLRFSVPPCLRGEYWFLFVAQPRCASVLLTLRIFSFHEDFHRFLLAGAIL